jgi:hypothetical protein
MVFIARHSRVKARNKLQVWNSTESKEWQNFFFYFLLSMPVEVGQYG